MDFLSPQLVWIEKRCYRVNNQAPIEPEKLPERNEYVEEDLMCEDDDDDSVDVEVLYDGSFRACLSEPAIFFSQIIGAKGATKLRIEKECGSRIFVPRQGSTGDIIVTSKLRKNVLTALRRIKLICLEARKKASCTHFCSIFFASPEIKSNFEKFKNEILADPVQNTQIDDSIFIHPEHLHLTLAVFPLLDEAEKGKAIEIFLECKQLILPHLKKSKDQLRLELVGVDSMEDFTDDSQVHVLYAKVQHEGLQEIANIFSARFAEEGFHARNHREQVRLHVTLMNTSKRARNEETKNMRYVPKIPFNGTHILKTYKDFYFGSVLVNEIHLSEMGTTGCDGYYKSISVIKL